MNKKMRFLSLVMIIAVFFTQFTFMASAANIEQDEQPEVISNEALSDYANTKQLMYNPKADTLKQRVAQSEKDLDLGSSKVRKSSVSKPMAEKLPSSFSLKAASFLAHLLQTNLSLYSTKFFVLPQKTQFGSYFFKTIVDPSTNISTGSFTLISNLFLISIGITTLPNSSILLTIPVDFIINPP